MFLSLPWLLLLCGLYSLQAQDDDEDYEERTVDKRVKNKLLTTNVIPSNPRLPEECSLELAFLVDSSESAKDN
ncbi:hypothetical protein UPYG_G00020140, partial [Umbra pygmaea]